MAKTINERAQYLDRPLDDEMSSLVRKFGADAVREAAKRATAKKRGRRPEKDWVGLRTWVDLDADDWLHDRDPFAIRSNYAVAKAFAEQFPGHNPFATKERIERKLRESRRWYMLVVAQQRSETEFPYDVHIRSLRHLAELNTHPVWQQLYEGALGRLIRYHERFGEPGPEKTYQQLQAELTAKPAGLSDIISISSATRGGIFGRLPVRNTSSILNPQE